MRLFAGPDVPLAKTAVCLLAEHGKSAREFEADRAPEPLGAVLRGCDGTVEPIGPEAGPLSQRLPACSLSSWNRGR